MPNYDQSCKACGWVWELWARPGEHPPCPKCGGETERIWLKSGNVIDDTLDEWNENVADQPVHFTSKTEKRRFLKEHGLLEFVRHVPHPRGKRENQTTRWI